MVVVEKTILIVDDDTLLLVALAEKFRREGFGVLEAKDGQEALAIALEKHPDIMLLDIMMPRMDGVTMLKELRKDPWGKGARVVLLTNVSDNALVAEALALGSYQYLVKADWSLEQIVVKVRAELGLP